MQRLNKDTTFHRKYYNTSKEIIHSLCGNELAMQKRPGLSVNLPHNKSDILPIHVDTLNEFLLELNMDPICGLFRYNVFIYIEKGKIY